MYTFLSKNQTVSERNLSAEACNLTQDGTKQVIIQPLLELGEERPRPSVSLTIPCALSENPLSARTGLTNPR